MKAWSLINICKRGLDTWPTRHAFTHQDALHSAQLQQSIHSSNHFFKWNIWHIYNVESFFWSYKTKQFRDILFYSRWQAQHSSKVWFPNSVKCFRAYLTTVKSLLSKTSLNQFPSSRCFMRNTIFIHRLIYIFVCSLLHTVLIYLTIGSAKTWRGCVLDMKAFFWVKLLAAQKKYCTLQWHVPARFGYWLIFLALTN